LLGWTRADHFSPARYRERKTSTGWFYGFKLYLAIDDQSRLVDACFTPGYVSDLKPVPKLTEKLSGKLIGDNGYISQRLFKEL
jgi:hypothetical protein